MRNSIFIKVQTVPLLQQIEQSDRIAESHLEIRPDSLPQVLQAANLREQGKDGFNQHSVVPLTFRTNFQILRLTRSAAKTSVRQNNHLLRNGFTKRQKGLVGNIGGRHRPISNQPELVRQQAKFAADNPTPGGVTFFADSSPLRLMRLSNWVTQLNAVRVNYTEDGRLGKKFFRQAAVRFQSPK